MNGDIRDDAVPEQGDDERQRGLSMQSTPMQSRRPSTVFESIQDEEHFAVKEDNDDPLVLKGAEDPMNWSNPQKWLLTIIVSSAFLNCTLASSMATGATQYYIEHFGASKEVATLVLSCYMIGFALGPLLWAPLSEVLGRKAVFVISIPCFMLLNVGCALSQNMPSLLVLRV